MNICHVINDLSRGGAETHLLSLVKVQIEEGDKVSIILLGNDLDNFVSLEEEFNLLNISLIRLKGPKKIQGFNPFSLIQVIKIFNDGYQIILDNLNHVASSNFNHLSKLCKVDIRIIDEMINNIKKLKPRPLDGIAEKIIELYAK